MMTITDTFTQRGMPVIDPRSGQHPLLEQVQLGLLCGPRRYADHGAVSGRW